MIDKELVELKRRLQVTTETCKDEVFDLSAMRFGCTDDEMYLEYKATPDRFHFKMSANNPKDPKVIHAHKQFCKSIGVPFKFFQDNRPPVREEMANRWLKSLAPGEKKALFLAKVRKGSNLKAIRALLPETHTSLTNSDIISTILSCDEYILDLDMSIGDSRDDLVLQTRILVGHKFYIGEEAFRMGFAVTCSELGASDLLLEAYLHHVESKTSFMGTYGGESFFKSKYTGIQPKEIKDMIPEFINRVVDEAEGYKDRIVHGPDFPGLEESCSIVANTKKIPKQFKRAIYLEAESYADDMGTSLDFARHMSLIAKDYDPEKRRQVERAAGLFLGLSFEKS